MEFEKMIENCTIPTRDYSQLMLVYSHVDKTMALNAVLKEFLGYTTSKLKLDFI